MIPSESDGGLMLEGGRFEVEADGDGEKVVDEWTRAVVVKSASRFL